MAYSVLQRVLWGGSGGSFGPPSTPGTTLICYIVSNSATFPTVVTTGVSVPVWAGWWSPGHNGDFTGVFYVRGMDNPGGITGFSFSGVYGSYYREVSGIPSNPTTYWNMGGNSTAGTTFSLGNPGRAVAGDFITDALAYNANNSGTARSDGWSDLQTMTNYGQTSYNGSTTTGISGTLASSGTWDASVLDFGQIDNNTGGWAAVGSLKSDNVTSGQTTMSVTVVNMGSLLVLYTKTAINPNYVTAVSGAGVGSWVQAMTGYTDTSGTPHVQQCWIAKAAQTGTLTLTLTYAASIGTTGVERNFQEFTVNNNDPSATFSVAGSPGNQNNTGTANYITWPNIAAPGSALGCPYVGFARVPGGSPYRSPSGPAVIQVNANNNAFIYALNMISGFQPQIIDPSPAVSSFCSGLFIKATIPLAGSASNGSVGTGSISATGVIAGAAPSASSASGAVVTKAVISGSSVATSSASGAIVNL